MSFSSFSSFVPSPFFLFFLFKPILAVIEDLGFLVPQSEMLKFQEEIQPAVRVRGPREALAFSPQLTADLIG
jgi:hypothetical protein